jgi:hypothetical protein
MATEGVDYAFSSPSPAGLAAAGKQFAMRYVGPGSSPKHLTVPEAMALDRSGLSIVTLVEGAADAARGGYAIGRQHAQSAVAMMRARGFPAARPMYFAIDYDVAASNWAGPREYLRGAGSVIGPALVGVYGEYDVMVWAARDRVAAWFFQTYAWSGGRWYAGNHVEQYRNQTALAGGIVDLCRAKVADYGQWSLSSQGDDELKPDERAWLYNASNIARAMVAGSNFVYIMDPETGVQTKTSMAPYWARVSGAELDEAQLAALGAVVGEAAEAGAEHALEDATIATVTTVIVSEETREA